MSKLLIVDDSSTMRQIILRILRQARLQVGTVIEASNGIEALAKLSANPDVSLILSDLNMPEMGGLDLVRKVRESRDQDQLPIVMVTTEGNEASREQALACGANDFVSRPFTAQTFSRALDPFVGAGQETRTE